MEKTFSSFTEAQGKIYDQTRYNYSQYLYQCVLDQHKATGGQFDTLVDVGCGPGMVTRKLATSFTHAIGLDPGEGMIATAQSLGGITASGEAIHYAISSAEELGKNLDPPIPDAGVDLITAGNAAHWFDMPGFWRSAARILKPGGSVALWTSGKLSVDPSMPNAAAIQAAFDAHQETNLGPYMTEGNKLTRDAYITLPLPWTLAEPVAEFDPDSFYRKDWTVEDPKFHDGASEVSLEIMEKVMAMGSPVIRWREAHPDAVGTENDVLRLIRREIERLLHKAGVEEGQETVKGTAFGALLVVKKRLDS